MIRLMNSAMMPQDGHYHRRSVSSEVFRDDFQQTNELEGGDYTTYIGYPQTARILSELLGREIPVSRQETRLRSGDVIFAIQLKYRLQSPNEKTGGQHGGRIQDYQFSIITYREEDIEDE